MSAHGLLNLLNKVGKRDKMRGLPSILSLFSAHVLLNLLNKLGNRDKMQGLQSIYLIFATS